MFVRTLRRAGKRPAGQVAGQQHHAFGAVPHRRRRLGFSYNDNRVAKGSDATLWYSIIGRLTTSSPAVAS